MPRQIHANCRPYMRRPMGAGVRVYFRQAGTFRRIVLDLRPEVAALLDVNGAYTLVPRHPSAPVRGLPEPQRAA